VSLYIYTQGFVLGYPLSGFQPFFTQTWSAIIDRLDARYLVAGVVSSSAFCWALFSWNASGLCPVR
jgi:hypothetical protein